MKRSPAPSAKRRSVDRFVNSAGIRLIDRHVATARSWGDPQLNNSLGLPSIALHWLGAALIIVLWFTVGG
jgi:hypothetical protein